jgi:hypothetical protein
MRWFGSQRRMLSVPEVATALSPPQSLMHRCVPVCGSMPRVLLPNGAALMNDGTTRRSYSGSPKASAANLSQSGRMITHDNLSLRGSVGLPERCQRSRGAERRGRLQALRAAYWVQAMGVANDNASTSIDRMGVRGRHSFDEAWSNAGLYPACRNPRHITAIAKGADVRRQDF